MIVYEKNIQKLKPEIGRYVARITSKTEDLYDLTLKNLEFEPCPAKTI